MSEIAPHRPAAVLLPPAAPALAADEGVRQVALLVYGLYLGSFLMPPAILGGLMLAYMNRETAPEWLKSHFTAQIRGFWLYLAYLTVSILLCAVLIGFVLIFVVMGWFITRQIMGLGWVLKGEAHPRPKSWLA
jgi:uncharacterized membrane protein